MNYRDIMLELFDEGVAKTDFYKEINKCIKTNDKLTFIDKIIEKYNCNFDDAQIVCDHLIDKIPLPSISTLSPQEQAHNNAVAQEWLNKPKCPTCQSTNIKSIGALERVGSVAMLGVFSKKINKTFKCKSCGYTW